MPERDAIWTTYLHYTFKSGSAIDRFLDWGISLSNKDIDFSSNTFKLTAILFTWFLSSTNMILRNLATKLLVCLLSNNIKYCIELLDTFKSIDDIYLQERLFAAVYGCILQNRYKFSYDNADLSIIAQFVYDTVFKDGNPPRHILLRDYALGIITVALNNGANLNIDKCKIAPPYKSTWAKPKMDKDSFKNKYLQFDAKNRNETNDYGFHYIWTSLKGISAGSWDDRLQFFSGRWQPTEDKNFTSLDAKIWIFERVLDLGWVKELHGQYDKNMSFYSRGKFNDKSYMMRIGEKYQWIAFYEFAGMVADNFKLLDITCCNRDKIISFNGPWQISLRDIDPSFLLRTDQYNIPTDIPFHKNIAIFNNWFAYNSSNDYSNWVKELNDISLLKNLIVCKDDFGEEWLALGGQINSKFSIDNSLEPKLNNFSVDIILNSYILDKPKLEIARNIIYDKNFSLYGDLNYDSSIDQVFLGEYPWSKSFLDINNSYFKHDGWVDIDEKGTKMILAIDKYENFEESLFNLINEVKSLNLPSKFLVDEMGIVQKGCNGLFYDKCDKLVAFDTALFNISSPNLIFMKKEFILSFLASNNLSIIFTILGYKITQSSSNYQLSERQTFQGIIYFNERGCLVDQLKTVFERYS